MIDAVDELIAHRKQFGSPSKMLETVYRFHKANRQVLDFLCLELCEVRAIGWKRASLGSLWHHARWVVTGKNQVPGESFVMSNNLFPWYGRIICILHPELNGFFEMQKSKADADFGVVLEPTPKNRKPGYIRRLVWADGTPLENGWKPAIKHEPKPVNRRERVRRPE